MEIRCYKMLDGRGKIYLPAALREAVGFSRNDVLQVTGRGGVILLNKADVNAADPVELLQEEFRQETAAAAGERPSGGPFSAMLPQSDLDKAVKTIGKTVYDNAVELARMAVDETHF